MREIKIEKTDKTVRIPKALREEIKRMGLESKIKFMKKELVYCPLHGKKISPIYCITCKYFVRRVKGVVYCRYP